MKKQGMLALVLAVLLCGCSAEPSTDPETQAAAPTDAINNAGELISERDTDPDYDESGSAIIYLNGSSAQCASNAVRISGSTVTITDEGTYILKGSLENGMIIVDSEKTDKTQIVLDGVDIHSETSAAIYVLQSDKVFLTLAEGSVNTLSNGGSFTTIDENNIDSVIFSKEDITLNGSGSLTITSPGGHGIVSKDSLTVTGGTYTVTSASHGLSGKDDVSITGAVMDITAGKDGIHAENEDDTSLGLVYIESGSFRIQAEGDGVSASAAMQILDGTFDIVSGGGSVNASQQTSSSWGGFMGGGGHGGGKPGSSWGYGSSSGSASGEDDSTSIKGIKAGTDLSISGGIFTIDAADDAIHANGSVTVSGGEFTVASGDDGFHADETLSITAGTVYISESYEGLEGLHVLVSGGDIRLYATDDGVNAAGGTDQSGFGGTRGNDRFGGGSSSNGSIQISGGKLYVNASGDGLDANGTLTISGGYTVVCGPTQGDTATLDYDVSGVITGGTFIGTGASGMAQSFSDSEQGVFAVNVGSAPAGSRITLTNSAGETVISYEPELAFSVVILSSPDIVKGETYQITVGSASGEYAAY